VRLAPTRADAILPPIGQFNGASDATHHGVADAQLSVERRQW